MTLKAIGDNVLFKFVDAINTRSEFKKEATASGIIIAGDTFDSSAREPRWGVVTAIGPSVEGIEIGQHVLIPALRWTEGVKHEGEKVWMTRVKEIVAVRADATSQPNAYRDWVLFIQRKDARMKSHGMIVVIEAADPTIRGTVFSVGTKVDGTQIATGDQLLFIDPNFADTISGTYGTFSFVREENILAVSN